MQSIIEREKRIILKGGPIYIPAQLVTILKCAKKSGPPYSVNEMETKPFLNWKDFSESIGNNYNVNEKRERVCWTEIKVI